MFVPKTVIIRREALEYHLGAVILEALRRYPEVEIKVAEGRRLPAVPGNTTPRRQYLSAKRTMVVAVRKTLAFQTCKPSAHYQLPLVTGCPGLCEYCYLQTTLGPRPFLTVYVNVDEILARARRYIEKRSPDLTFFEAAAAGDPVPVEPYTGSLARAIDFFASQDDARLRVATKFDDVDSFLNLEHRGHTHFRFSLNTPFLINSFERGVIDLKHRLRAARMLAEKGYPIGFIIAPILPFPGWESEYTRLARVINSELQDIPALRCTLEFITHRFTARAKKLIISRNPRTSLPLCEKERVARKGQFGYTKYVFPPATQAELKQKVTSLFTREMPYARIEYFI